MVLLTNSSSQAVSAGGTLSFDTDIYKTGCVECHRANSGVVRLVSGGIYEIHFNANVTGADADTEVSLAIQIDGSTLAETTMVYTPSTADIFGHVSATTMTKTCNSAVEAISVANIGDVEVTVENPCLLVKRIA